MKTLRILTTRNIKLFFSDKGMFFTSLVTPLILLVLYFTFLSNVYRDSLAAAFGQFKISERVIDSFVSGQLISSILSVSCVTVAFCSNMLMVQDKVTGSIKDLTIAPVKKTTLSLAYYAASLTSTLIVCMAAAVICIAFAITQDAYITVKDSLMLVFDILLLSMFGTALSSIINYFLSTQGQISAVGSIISSCYGFICGAYMPISSFSEGLQKILSFLPGTYGTSLVRNHSLRSTIKQMENENIPVTLIDEIKNSFDMNVKFFDNTVSESAMYAYLIITVLVLVAVYVLINIINKKDNSKN